MLLILGLKAKTKASKRQRRNKKIMKVINRFMNFVRSIPMAIPGIALALAALGNLLIPSFMTMNDYGVAVPRDGILTVRIILGSIALFILVLFALKIILDRKHAGREWRVHVPLSVLPTATMALILISSYLVPFTPPMGAPTTGVAIFALIVWFLAIACQLFVMGLFYYRFIFKKPAPGPKMGSKGERKPGSRLGAVFPSWFIIGVGIVAVSVTAPWMGRALLAAGAETPNFALALGRIAFYVGFSLYFLTLPFVIWRMKKVKIFPEPLKKTIAIFAAPMGLLVVGYINAFNVMPPAIVPGHAMVPHDTFSPILLYIMLAIAVISYIYVLAMMIPLLRIRFYPTYAAFTFPLVISAMAFRLATNFLNTQLEGGAGHIFAQFMNVFSHFALILAIVAVLFVIICYVKYFVFWLTFTRSTKNSLPVSVE